MDFKKLYFTLFNTLSDAVEQIDPDIRLTDEGLFDVTTMSFIK